MTLVKTSTNLDFKTKLNITGFFFINCTKLKLLLSLFYSDIKFYKYARLLQKKYNKLCTNGFVW